MGLPLRGFLSSAILLYPTFTSHLEWWHHLGPNSTVSSSLAYEYIALVRELHWRQGGRERILQELRWWRLQSRRQRTELLFLDTLKVSTVLPNKLTCLKSRLAWKVDFLTYITRPADYLSGFSKYVCYEYKVVREEVSRASARREMSRYTTGLSAPSPPHMHLV